MQRFQGCDKLQWSVQKALISQLEHLIEKEKYILSQINTAWV